MTTVPESLRPLIQSLEELDEYTVASDVIEKVSTLLEKVWTDGSFLLVSRENQVPTVCQPQPIIPLATAIRFITPMFDLVKQYYVLKFVAELSQYGIGFGSSVDTDKLNLDVNAAFAHLTNLEIAQLSFYHWEHIQSSLTMICEERGLKLMDEFWVVQQFCVQMTQWIVLFHQRTGRKLEGVSPQGNSHTQQQQRLIYTCDFNELNLSKGPLDWLRLFGPKEKENMDEDNDGDDEENGP